MALAKRRTWTESNNTTIPRYSIDLSLDPQCRYVELAKQYRPQLQRLTVLFDSLLSDLGIPRSFHKSINQVARLLLRRVYSPIETAELRGISMTAGIPLYLLVSLNVVLDLLMGCTSGAARTLEDDHRRAGARMLHFRTLDWAMDPLRLIVVQLDFIRCKSVTKPQVLGSSITYVGFVGILTGVRERLSLSLNFRAVHNASTNWQQFRFYFHHLLVLFGLRQSISSMLRSCLFGGDKHWSEKPSTLDEITNTVPVKHTTAAYLIFCDGKRSISMEKDYRTAIVRQSQTFIVTTNNDLAQHSGYPKDASPAFVPVALQDLLQESEDRRNCVVGKWKAKLRQGRRRRQRATEDSTSGTYGQICHKRSLRSGKQPFERANVARSGIACSSVDEDDLEHSISVTKEELIRWTCDFPTSNEMTHFATILDPGKGQVLWSKRYLGPIGSSSEQGRI